MKKIFNTATVLLILIVTFMLSGTAQAGNTADQMERAGYDCWPGGPSGWTHCWIESKIGNQVIPVKVFSKNGTEFLGTELLLRDDVYGGQPCPQDGLALWDHIDFGEGLGYFACHGFHTGHNP